MPVDPIQPIRRVPVGSNLYLFESPNAKSNQCLIVAHSGRRDEDSGTLMPPGTSTHFYTVDGSTRRGSAGDSVALGRAGANVAETIRPREESWNYRFQKLHDKQGSTYRNIKDEMGKNTGDWQPHVVTVRNRWIGARTMHLSDIINEVQRQNPNITEFHVGGCRQTKDGVGALPPLKQAQAEQAARAAEVARQAQEEQRVRDEVEVQGRMQAVAVVIDSRPEFTSDPKHKL